MTSKMKAINLESKNGIIRLLGNGTYIIPAGVVSSDLRYVKQTFGDKIKKFLAQEKKSNSAQPSQEESTVKSKRQWKRN